MDLFTKKTLKTSRGYTYTYYTLPGSPSKPALFFQHGWPDHAAMWSKVAQAVHKELPNYPIIIPDMLGYDGTDKPTDPAEYAWDKMTRDMIDILDAESPNSDSNEGSSDGSKALCNGKALSIGHDWGSAAASRLYNYHPTRIVGLVNCNVAYMPPTGEAMDLEQTNQAMEKHFGAPLLAYWEVFADPQGHEILGAGVEKMFQSMHGKGDAMGKFFTRRGGVRASLTDPESGTARAGARIELRDYAREEGFKEAFVERMRRDGFAGPQCWYRAAAENVQSASERALFAEHGKERAKVRVPALYIGTSEDPVCKAEHMLPAVQGGLLDEKVWRERVEIEGAGHWVMDERPEEVARGLVEWVMRAFGA